MTVIEVPGFLTVTIAITVFFAGAGLNRNVKLLRQWNIPEAVTGGLLAALVTLAIHAASGYAINFHTAARDLLLLYFFTSIGLNARIADLLAGGRTLALLLAVTIAYLIIQDLIAMGACAALGLPDGVAIFLGSASLIGGHGTTIAWAPVANARFGLSNGLEIGLATATLGLVVASVTGGPIARHLITRHHLASAAPDELMMALPQNAPAGSADISHVSVLRVLLLLNIVIIIAYAADKAIAQTGFTIPLFVVCLFTGIVLTNLVPRLVPRLHWPARSRELTLLSNLALNIFLAISLMSMQLWTLGGLGLALLLVLALQTLAAIAYILFIVFPLLGRDYEAAVLASGFTGISLGSTPTAIANMTAVTKLHGPAPRAFIILPLVSAFFIDIANAVAITWMLR